ncbi:MAG: nucleoside 2-deoxyribosyltransferase [Armatimonadota bacterium]|nr:nucleoside 2-deoxyribosyltransferase [Armatimonadota bacterium]MDR7402524.1 nucleoside 2-deoxyribosyltransferase [Armatimonadota bacterium]MDR7403698.1 nucleoside 2-deoxyribosyltransferase [Armatimonadota bacterium]MDR7436087.1 nucleoside 2-deoxyribosyltransferase [Armatimonadota bacterium]MDR7471966.1 nucleoside 2-deoxyribosyltransferase [Armatimonadota bacterium]
MTAPFECEVRFPIGDLAAFRRRVASLGGRAVGEYAFTDHYYRLPGASDPAARSLRVREHHAPPQPAELLLSWVDLQASGELTFKRSRFPEGKLCLHRADPAACHAVAAALGGVPWVVVRKTAGTLYELPGLGGVAVEHVDGVGWMGEVEAAGADPQAAAAALRRRLEALGVAPASLRPHPLAAQVAGGSGRAVYFSGSIRGGRALQPTYAALVAFLERAGYRVLTAHVAAPDVLEQEQAAGASPRDIYRRDREWLAACDLVVAEVSVPSLGVGVEIATAQHLGKPVVCLCQQDVALSAMVAGNDWVRLIRYRDADDAVRLLEAALQEPERSASHLSDA